MRLFGATNSEMIGHTNMTMISTDDNPLNPATAAILGGPHVWLVICSNNCHPASNRWCKTSFQWQITISNPNNYPIDFTASVSMIVKSKNDNMYVFYISNFRSTSIITHHIIGSVPYGQSHRHHSEREPPKHDQEGALIDEES